MAETQSQVATTLAGHSGRLKYANPQDLPSFPSTGLRKDGAAAGAAASLGWANQKTIDPWKPDKSASASAAAVLAKDYKMPPQWQPDPTSSAGAKAALLATASAKRQQEQQAASLKNTAASHSKKPSFGSSAATQAALRQNSTTAASSSPAGQANFGSSAATSAFRSSLSVRRPADTSPQTASPGRGNTGSLSAAQSAMPRRRQRAVSTPTIGNSYPDEANAAANALKAATAAAGPSLANRSLAENGGAVPYTALPRNMYTSHPKIGPEADDAKRADMLHASAVAMAKKMYSQQQKMADQTREAYAGRDDGSSIEENAPRPYVNLQEAAYKLAQERLAKLEEEHKSQKFQEYYGGSPGRRNTLQRRFTMKSRLRRRSSSDGEVDDMEQSERIRQQMSIFSTNLTKVDEQKRAKDREAVLAAAQRNVRAQLKGMDDRVFNDTGKLPPPRKLSEWELKAHEAAQSMHASRNENKGKVNMGGGMFMSPEDVDAIAQSRVQPLLDEINEKAAIERERQEILRSEAEAKKRDEEKSRERDREIKEINKKIKDQEKAEEKERRQKEKQELKAKKDEEKAIKAEEKRKSKMTDAAAVAEDHHSDHSENDAEPMSHVHPEPLDTTHHDSSPTEARSPKEAGSPTHKVKTWLKARLHRPRGKSGSGEASQGFIGGATLNSRLNESSTSLDNRAASMREMAEAGRGRTNATSRGSTRARDVSPMSSEDGDGDNAKLEKTITPPVKLRDPNEDKGSPSRDSRFRENLE
ncbi:hypothetical protein B0T11DRAFT_280073 [Plectosphaerella cucumerina]|uniref:Eisosome protein 1 n=1 Tax=Plectosphaerella cucumerina TaxID=40658 RepID=A0A8K0TCE1_9PEZI|nr:hypothetical protein B0T11DRAFT_280073 [Plectosphaerella cucumerina]